MANVKKSKKPINSKNNAVNHKQSIFEASIDTDNEGKNDTEQIPIENEPKTDTESTPVEASDNFTQQVETTISSQQNETAEETKSDETSENTEVKQKRRYNKTGNYSKKKKVETSEKPRFTIGSSDFDNFKNDLESFNQTTQNAENAENAENTEVTEPTEQTQSTKITNESAELIQGYMLLMFIDFIFPAGITFLFNKFNTKFYVESKDLSLTDDEFRKLEPIADKAAIYLNLRLNPALLFVLALGAMYTKKIAQVQKPKPVKETKKAA